MVKKLFILVVLATILFANLQDKIKTYMGEKEYVKQENLIKILFKDSSSFYRQTDGNVDSLKVISVLKDNGLFKLFLNKPISLHVEFMTDKNPLIFMKVISESLDAIGYNYFLTSEAKKIDQKFSWLINLKTKHLINPILFAKELQKRGCAIDDIIEKNDYSWIYKIDSTNAKLNTRQIEADTTIKLPKPIEPYWIENHNFSLIKLRSSFSDHWYPLIVFFDSGLHVISQTKMNKRTYAVKLDVPENCKYIRVSDIYTLDNIKHGLSVYLKSNN